MRYSPRPSRRSGPSRRSRCSKVAGFTLIEILIVVIILGILSGIVLPSLTRGSGDSSRAAFVTNLRTYAQLFELQNQKAGAYPSDRNPGVLPPELVGTIRSDDWGRMTPIGGQWDWDRGVFGIKAGVSVYRPNQTQAQMVEVDRALDDGNLTTGRFRRRSDGYIYILEQ